MFLERRRMSARSLLYIGMITILLAIIGWLLATRHVDKPVPENRAVPAAVASEVAHVATVATPIKSGTVKTYAPAAKAKLKLPDAVVNDSSQQVIAASQIKPSDHPQTVSTIINSETGEAQTFVREDPLPWLAWDTHGEAGLYLGVKNGEKAARLEVRQGVAAIKAAHLGVIASADQPLSSPLRADYFVGAGVWMRW